MAFAQEAARLCLAEWTRFDEGAGQETESPFKDFVKEYWVSIGVDHLDGATEEPTPWNPDETWRPPWSAAFISFIVRRAGGGSRFAYGPGHAAYVGRAWRESAAGVDSRLYHVHHPDNYSPRVGDLVHFSRTGEVAEFRDARRKWSRGEHYSSHCDLVVAVDPGHAFIDTIGGNTRDGDGASGHTVGRKRIALDEDGFIPPRKRSPWLAVLECRDR